MEEDEQAPQQPEGEGEGDKEPEPLRCGRHPSQLLTGICSSCLMERLSSVRDDQPDAEILEVGAGEPAAGPTKLRKTLMLLFQLDDSDGSGAHPSEADPGFQLRSGGGGDRGGARKGGPGSWLRSILPRRAMRWRRNGGAAKEPSPAAAPSRRAEPADPSASGSGDVRVERKPSFRRSCEWMMPSFRDPSRGSLEEPPRHSWDGSMVGRAFACSFACLDEQEPTDAAGRVRRSNVEEAPGDARAVAAAAETESRNGGPRPGDPCTDAPRFSGRRSCDADTGTGMEMPVSGGVGRRRSNRWSRVWDRSITSPLMEFVKKGEHVLERSLSESRREVRRGKNAEAASDISSEFQPGRNGHAPGRGASRSSQAASNGDVQSFRTDWLRNSKIGRSRSVHYTSPGNLDNGMLRFYLTPMRSTRTANRGRRSSRLFARGLFGFI